MVGRAAYRPVDYARLKAAAAAQDTLAAQHEAKVTALKVGSSRTRERWAERDGLRREMG